MARSSGRNNKKARRIRKRKIWIVWQRVFGIWAPMTVHSYPRSALKHYELCKMAGDPCCITIEYVPGPKYTDAQDRAVARLAEEVRLGIREPDRPVTKEPEMTPEHKEKLITAWIRYQKSSPDDNNREKDFWAVSEVMHATDYDPELAWDLLLAILERDKSAEIIPMLGAVILEHLLAQPGPRFIGRVEAQARKDPAFLRILRYIGDFGMRRDVRKRVEKLLGPGFKIP